PRAAVLVVRAVPAERSLFQLLRDPGGEAVAGDSKLWFAVGRLVGTLSARRFAWCDVSAKHLYPRRIDDGWQLFLIDVERMASPGECDDVGAFRTLLQTLPIVPQPAAVAAMADGFLAAGGAGPINAVVIAALASHAFSRKPAIPDDYWMLRPAEMVNDRGLIARSNWRESLAEAGLGDMDAIFRFDRGQSLGKPGLPAHRRRDRVVLGDRVLYLKRYRPSLWRRISRSLAMERYGSEAADEWHALYRLAYGGIPVPEPVLLGESSRKAAARSAVGLAELPDAQSLERWLPRVGRTLSPAQRRELLRRLAEFVAHFHSLGTVHRDLYLCHIFIRWSGAVPIFWLIDLARVFRPVRWRRRRWVVKDLSQLRYSLGEMVSEGEWLDFLAHYAVGESTAQLANHVASKVRSIARHAASRRKRLGTP
ncbi:MAG: lipopolysaccharide kinase InaA family protein, partial [Phycisphaerae bacterium]|nr:lipopolysaccharide kinase InaA family protein [Phycisphaerae bacterium]